MTLTLHTFVIETFAGRLRSLGEIIGRAAAEHPDPAALPAARLAPDMYDLARQVQLACFHAVNCTRRLIGDASPAQGDPPATIADMKSCIEGALIVIEAVDPEEMTGAADLQIVFPGPPGSEFRMSGGEYLYDWALPNFYFHLVTAYDILRNAGLPIGKRDFLSTVGRYIHQTS